MPNNLSFSMSSDSIDNLDFNLSNYDSVCSGDVLKTKSTPVTNFKKSSWSLDLDFAIKEEPIKIKQK